MMKRYTTLCCAAMLLLLSQNAISQSYQVGFSLQTFNDASRNRDIPAAVYYPSNTAGENVPVANSQTGFPVISFGHGFVIETDSYSWLWEELVPQGYILVFPQTEGSLLPAPSHPNFGLDIAFCADEIIRLGNLPSGPLSGKVLPRAAYMGHSMGGGATYLAAAGSNTVSTTITLGAADTNPSSIAAAAQVDVPSLVIAAVEDCVTPVATNQEPMYNNLPASQKAIVRIEGASHCNFTDGSASLCFLGEGFSCFGFGPFTSRQIQHQRSLEVLVPWLDAFLKKDCLQAEALTDILVEGTAADKWTYDLTGAESLACPAECAVPTGLSSSGDALSGYTLSWDEVPYSLGYQYRIRKAGGGPSLTESTALNTVTTESLPAQYNYEFRVRAFCPSLGLSSWAAWTPLAPLGTEQNIDLALRGDHLMISQKSGQARHGMLEVYSLDGKLIWNKYVEIPAAEVAPNDVNMAHLAHGFYLIVLSGDTSGRAYLKVIR